MSKIGAENDTQERGSKNYGKLGTRFCKAFSFFPCLFVCLFILLGTWLNVNKLSRKGWEHGFWKPDETRAENLTGILHQHGGENMYNPKHAQHPDIAQSPMQHFLQLPKLHGKHHLHAPCVPCLSLLSLLLGIHICNSPCAANKGCLLFRTHLSREREKNVCRTIFDYRCTSWAVLSCTKDPHMERTLAHRWSPFCTRGN